MDQHSSFNKADRLSTFLRMALEERDARTVPLARELAFADAYLSIERVRFSDRLSVETRVDETIRSVEVPHLLLQPLVENAVRHGIAPWPTTCPATRVFWPRCPSRSRSGKPLRFPS